MTADAVSLVRKRSVDCPRCHEACGWCSDYRFMHGQLRLPGSKRRCTVPGLEPEGVNCPLCAGARKVIATITFTPIETPTPPAPGSQDRLAAGSDPGPPPQPRAKQNNPERSAQ